MSACAVGLVSNKNRTTAPKKNQTALEEQEEVEKEICQSVWISKNFLSCFLLASLNKTFLLHFQRSGMNLSILPKDNCSLLCEKTNFADDFVSRHVLIMPPCR